MKITILIEHSQLYSFYNTWRILTFLWYIQHIYFPTYNDIKIGILKTSLVWSAPSISFELICTLFNRLLYLISFFSLSPPPPNKNKPFTPDKES